MHLQVRAKDVHAMSAFYRAVLVVEVDDVEATLERVERLGGRRTFPGTPPEPMELASAGGAEVVFELREFEDPEGNLVGIIHR